MDPSFFKVLPEDFPVTEEEQDEGQGEEVHDEEQDQGRENEEGAPLIIFADNLPQEQEGPEDTNHFEITNAVVHDYLVQVGRLEVFFFGSDGITKLILISLHGISEI